MFFLSELSLSSSIYPPISFLWGRYAEEEKEAMTSECLKCAVVPTQATLSSSLNLCGFLLFPELGLPLFMLMLQPELDHTVCSPVFTVDLIC